MQQKVKDNFGILHFSGTNDRAVEEESRGFAAELTVRENPRFLGRFNKKL